MEIIITFIITALWIFGCYGSIKSHEKWWYIFILVFNFVILVNHDAIPFFNIVNQGYMSFALWFFVMIATLDILPRNIRKNLISVRKEVSIIAFIFTTTHFIHDFIITTQLDIVIGYIAYIIMIPLWVLSFRHFRKKIAYQKWKDIQRWAYLAYVFIFLHLIFVTPRLLHLAIYLILLLFYFIQKLKSSSLKMIIVKVIVVLLVLSIGYIKMQYIRSYDKNTDHPLDEVNDQYTSEGIYNDGEYITTADGYRQGLTVKTTLKNNRIIAIEILSHNEVGVKYYGPAIDKIPGRIIEEQSVNVDAVSRATYTSHGIMLAVHKALQEAIIHGEMEEIEEYKQHQDSLKEGKYKTENNNE